MVELCLVQKILLDLLVEAVEDLLLMDLVVEELVDGLVVVMGHRVVAVVKEKLLLNGGLLKEHQAVDVVQVEVLLLFSQVVIVKCILSLIHI